MPTGHPEQVGAKRRQELAALIAERMRVLGLSQQRMLAHAGIRLPALRNMLDATETGYRARTIFGVADALGFDRDGFARWVRAETDIAPVLADRESGMDPRELAERIAALAPENRRRVEELVVRLGRSDAASPK